MKPNETVWSHDLPDITLGPHELVITDASVVPVYKDGLYTKVLDHEDYVIRFQSVNGRNIYARAVHDLTDGTVQRSVLDGLKRAIYGPWATGVPEPKDVIGCVVEADVTAYAWESAGSPVVWLDISAYRTACHDTIMIHGTDWQYREAEDTTPEGQLKKGIKEYLRSVGAYWSMIPGGAYGRPGEPDMVVCHKGRYVAIEAKTPTGRQSEWQRARQQEIEAAGGIYVLARSVDDVRNVIDPL